jgi:hypothetical protein
MISGKARFQSRSYDRKLKSTDSLFPILITGSQHSDNPDDRARGISRGVSGTTRPRPSGVARRHSRGRDSSDRDCGPASDRYTSSPSCGGLCRLAEALKPQQAPRCRQRVARRTFARDRNTETIHPSLQGTESGTPNLQTTPLSLGRWRSH